jgi:UDP-N-acetylmuramyl tripeptide synthase
MSQRKPGSMKLEELTSPLLVQRVIGDPAVEVRGIAYHSREVAEGFLFAAIRGLQEDGRRSFRMPFPRPFFWSMNPGRPEVVQAVVPNVREALARTPHSTEIHLHS